MDLRKIIQHGWSGIERAACNVGLDNLEKLAVGWRWSWGIYSRTGSRRGCGGGIVGRAVKGVSKLGYRHAA